MSNIQNTIIQERVLELVEEIFQSPDTFLDDLAYKLLDGMDYYLYCKEDAWDKLESHIDGVSDKVFESCGDYSPNSIEETKEIISSIYKLGEA